ncbi:MAG: prolyl aminopeptidase [Candidatus Puniceispirillaceae bacterium]|jgi:proline iminopeptidase
MMNAFIQEHDLFPAALPFHTGRLSRDGHDLYFEECGKQTGRPILFLHGGPGAGIAPSHRRLFNPDRFRCVLFDQRGSGQSRPFAAIETNTTELLIGDIEALRQHLGIDKFILFGGSWGSTLALAYAIAYPEHVESLILRGIFLGTADEVSWFLHDMGRFFPEAHDRFVSYIPEDERDDILHAYYQRLTSSNPAIYQPAADRWASYETSCSTLRAGSRHMSGAAALSMARIEAHYFRHNCFMPDSHILSNIDRIKHLSAHIIQGRHDVICPPFTAQKLALAWGKNARLQMIDEAGHSTFERGIAHALLAALDSI